MQGWKTVIFGALLALVGFLQGINWEQLIPNNPTVVGWITSGIGVVIVVLRMFTSTPVGQKS